MLFIDWCFAPQVNTQLNKRFKTGSGHILFKPVIDRNRQLVESLIYKPSELNNDFLSVVFNQKVSSYSLTKLKSSKFHVGKYVYLLSVQFFNNSISKYIIKYRDVKIEHHVTPSSVFTTDLKNTDAYPREFYVYKNGVSEFKIPKCYYGSCKIYIQTCLNIKILQSKQLLILEYIEEFRPLVDKILNDTSMLDLVRYISGIHNENRDFNRYNLVDGEASLLLPKAQIQYMRETMKPFLQSLLITHQKYRPMLEILDVDSIMKLVEKHHEINDRMYIYTLVHSRLEPDNVCQDTREEMYPFQFVDFENMHFGNPLQDLHFICAFFRPKNMTLDEIIQYYLQLNDPFLEDGQNKVFTVLEFFFVKSLLSIWIKWIWIDKNPINKIHLPEQVLKNISKFLDLMQTLFYNYFND